MWKNLGFGFNKRPSILSWFFWSVFTGLQLASWKIYYVILPLQNYMKLILAGGIQLMTSISILLLPAFDQPLILPIALSCGLTLGLFVMLSSKYFQRREN
jgi:O-antigen/teichoic acid export membrane protein